MEFTNEIFFNKPLIAGSTVIITYNGQLYREHSKDVSIVFGYGENWDETDSATMLETENGFEITLTLKDYSTFNFCFKNSFNIWDNNSGFNYIAPISPNENKTSQDESNDNTPKSDGLSNNTEEASEISTSTEDVENQNEENQSQDTNENEVENEAENSAKFDTTEKQADDIEAIFSSLLDSILDGANSETETIDISNLPGFGLQSIDEIKEEDMINCDTIFAELFDELTENKAENIETEAISQPEVTNYDKYDAQELDNLMDNLLTSISDSAATSDYATPVQTIEESQDLANENVGLPATLENNDWVDKILNISYNFTKKITTACKKFGSLLKLKAKELGLISDK